MGSSFGLEVLALDGNLRREDSVEVEESRLPFSTPHLKQDVCLELGSWQTWLLATFRVSAIWLPRVRSVSV